MPTRFPRSPVPLTRPLRADPARYFSTDEITRARSYQRPLQRIGLLGTLLTLAVVLTIVATGAAQRLLDAVAVDGWVLQLLLVLAALLIVLEITSLPLSIRKYRHEAQWGFSTRTLRGFLLDEIQQTLIFGFGLSALLLVPVWALVRATDLWWLWGSVTATAVTGALVFLYPVVILPLMNKLTPLDDHDLEARLRALADRAGVSVGEFSVMDASKRTKKDNAFVAGLGKTRRVAIYDSTLSMPHEQIEIIVGHEMGHWRRGHLLLGIVMSSVQFPVIFGLIAAVTSPRWVRDWAGIEHLGDPAALPLFGLASGLAFSTVRMASAWVSRWLERTGDLDALELTGDPQAAANAWRSMVDRNLPDLDPSWWARVRASHPPVVERIRFTEVWAEAKGSA